MLLLVVLGWQHCRCYTAWVPVQCGTAGSPAKRSLLRSLGVSTVVASRDTSFVSDLAVAGGVDVVLNSLTSPGMVSGSLSVLRRGGRFVEIAKRDIWAPAAVAAERPDVAYSLLAVDFLPASGLHTALFKLAAQLAGGAVHPLPAAVHKLSSVAAALRQMSHARHIGKVVVSPPQSGAPGSQFSSAGAVLVVGGSGSLGSLVGVLAGWSKQFKCIVALSRSGQVSPVLAALLHSS